MASHQDNGTDYADHRPDKSRDDMQVLGFNLLVDFEDPLSFVRDRFAQAKLQYDFA